MEWEVDKGPPYKFGMGPPEGLIRPCKCHDCIGLLSNNADVARTPARMVVEARSANWCLLINVGMSA